MNTSTSLASMIQIGHIITYYLQIKDFAGFKIDRQATERVAKIGRGSNPTSLRFVITESGRKVYLHDVLGCRK